MQKAETLERLHEETFTEATGADNRGGEAKEAQKVAENIRQEEFVDWPEQQDDSGVEKERRKERQEQEVEETAKKTRRTSQARWEKLSQCRKLSHLGRMRHVTTGDHW